MFAYQALEWADVSNRLRALSEALRDRQLRVASYRDTTGKALEDVGPVDGQRYTVREAIEHAEKVARIVIGARIPRNRPVPVKTMAGIVSQVQNLDTALNDLTGQIDQLGSLGDLRANNGSVLVNSANEIKLNLTDPARRLVEHADALFSTVAPAAGNGFPKTAMQQAELVEVELGDEASRATLEALRTAQAAALEADSQAQRMAHLVAGAEAARAEAERTTAAAADALQSARAEAEKGAEQIAGTQATADANAAVLAARMDDAHKLKSQMDELHRTIATFAAGVDTADKKLAETGARGAKLASTLEAQSVTVKRLVADAEAMLSGSTVAGLAATFKAERDGLDKDLRGAFAAFCGGIAMLILLSFFLAAYVLNLPIEIAGLNLANPSEKANNEVTLAGVLSRAILILGPFWFTLFSSRRYKQLFDLRQQYSHKYNMAFAMEGFKKQSKTHAEAIAAWVFTIVAKNPVEQKPGRPMDESPMTSLREFGAGITDDIVKRLAPPAKDTKAD